MCGISGSLRLSGDGLAFDAKAAVNRMCGIQHHRGPDDSGVTAVGAAVLGSNRLSIIDLSAAGHMPMSNEDGTLWITYNGEIFNFQDLRAELVAIGHNFRSRTDTEVVLHAYEEWGNDCFSRFVGMFGLALYDPRANRLILARDRFGKKPVYYTFRSGHLLFASEMKALIAVSGDLRPNMQRLAEWSLYRNVDFGSRETLIDGIHSLPPGQFMVVTPDPAKGAAGVKVNTESYFQPEAEVNRADYERFNSESDEKVRGHIESLIVRGVRDRLMSDVPIGTLCSGGIDSSLITAICAREMPDILAFNVSVAGYEALDESRYAARAAESLGVRLLTYSMQPEDFQRNLVRAIYHSDVPLTHPNSVAFLLISQFARSQGVKILLSGEAADELFGGYMQRYRRYRQVLRFQQAVSYLPAKVRKLIVLAGYACDGVPITDFSEYEGLLRHSTGFLDRFAREELKERSQAAYGFVENPLDRAVLGAMLADLTNFLTPLLRRLDRMSSAASVEARAPFLDYQLVRAVINLPLRCRLRGRQDKWLLKTIAARYLPREIVYRKKVGFPLPLADYIAPFARPELFASGFCVEYLGAGRKALLSTVSDWRRNFNGFFNLLALELWGRIFFMNEPVENLTEWVLSPAATKEPVRRPARQAVSRVVSEPQG
ncbi:MAG: asparagine synthase (glutamine-hydrolyzing) [Acidobacteria bacterium]|nr:MAG: asparagine synthase (glutamine-hydrolyzing) [Acidobacteriota bacterium]